MSPPRLPARVPPPSCNVGTVRVLPCLPATPRGRRVRWSGMLTSLLVHGMAAACAALIAMQSLAEPPNPTAGGEGAAGDESTAVIPQTLRRQQNPAASIPAVIRDTPRRLLASAPSALTLPEEVRSALPVSLVLPRQPVEMPAVASSSNVPPTPGKSKSRRSAGSRGNGGSGGGTLRKGNGSGMAAPSSPRLLTQTAPDYPSAARRRGASGTAWVRVEVSSGGAVSGASLHRSCGHEDLDAAAVRTARRWRFAPATAGGLPVSAAAVVKVAFVLHG